MIFCNMVHHDVLHLLVAQMESIQIGDVWVDGVSGLKVKHFHQTAWEPLYDGGTLDELRIAIHEAILLPSLVSILRLTEWSRWMLTRKINPASVILITIKLTKNGFTAIKLPKKPT